MSRTSSQHGFTIIELIVSSGIFAAVLLMGFATLAQATTFQQKAASQRLVGETARLTLESITRRIRLANGFLPADAQIKPLGSLAAPSFAILNGTVDADGLTKGSQLQIATTDYTDPLTATQEVSIISLQKVNNHSFVQLNICTDPTCLSFSQTARLTPDSVEVTNLQFRGLLPSSSQTDLYQPFLEITLGVSTGPTVDPKTAASQVLRTVISSRNYPF